MGTKCNANCFRAFVIVKVYSSLHVFVELVPSVSTVTPTFIIILNSYETRAIIFHPVTTLLKKIYVDAASVKKVVSGGVGFGFGVVLVEGSLI